MGKYIDKSDEPEYHQYESSLKSIEILVKKLKNQTDSIHTHDASKLNQSVQQIVDFMAKSAVIGQKFYSKSILILDNALVLNQNLFFQIELPDLFMENLSKFFIRISKYIQNNEQKINEERVENILYGSLYLILLLIYKAGSHHQNKNQLMLKVFTRAFITNLSNLPISHCSSKTIRVLSMILAFLIKKKHLRNEVKSITLEIISTCSDEVTRVYLVFIIKNIISDLKHFQIFKYKILDFLLTCLSAQENQVILNCLVSIYSLILHHRELIDSLIKKKFMKHWDAQIANFPTICLKILKILLPYFCVEKKQSWFNLYLDHVMLKKDQSCHVHVDIIEQLVKQLPGSVIVRYIEHNLLWEIENRMRDSRDQLLRKALGKFKQSLLIRLSEIDSNLVILYRSITERSLNLVLSDLN